MLRERVWEIMQARRTDNPGRVHDAPGTEWNNPMAMQNKAALALVTMGLSACAHMPQSLIALDGAPVDDLSQVAQVSEHSDHPLLLRGLDQVPLDTLRVPGGLSEYVYVLKAGRHTLWVMSMPYGHPLMPQKIRCYVIEVVLAAGTRYRLLEDTGRQMAGVLSDATGEGVAWGRLVDEPWVFSGSCRWQQ
jgi:hypothetical protein